MYGIHVVSCMTNMRRWPYAWPYDGKVNSGARWSGKAPGVAGPEGGERTDNVTTIEPDNVKSSWFESQRAFSVLAF